MKKYFCLLSAMRRCAHLFGILAAIFLASCLSDSQAQSSSASKPGGNPGRGAKSDTIPPNVSFSEPVDNSTVGGTIAISATASDNVGVVGVQFKLDGSNFGNEDKSAPYSVNWDTTASSNSTHTLSAVARDAAGNISTVSINAAVNNPGFDTQAPSAPGGLEATPVTATQINLTWSASTDNVGVSGYKIYRNTAYVGTSATSNYSDTGLNSGATYTYAVSAYDTANNESAQSATVTASTPSVDTTAPTVIFSNPTNNVTVSNTVTVSANASDNIGVVGVQFKLDGANFGAEVTSAPYSVSWDTNTASNSTHSLSAVARDAAGNGATVQINVVVSNVVPDTQAPSAPGSLSASPASSSQINLTWNASTDNVGVVGYKIYRNSSQVGTSTTTNYSDSGLSASTVYSYTVVAYDAAGNTSSPSNSASATTQAVANSYTTNFVATENPISESGNWINGKAKGVDWNNVKTANGRATATVVSGNPSRYNDSIAKLNSSFSSNQYAQATVYRASGYDPSPSGHEVELLLRFNITPNSASGYEILWGAPGYLAVVRWNGPLGDYTPLLDTGLPGIGPAVDGDVFRAEINGNTIAVLKNGSVVATVDIRSSGGAVYTTGQPGMGFWPVDGASIDKFGWKSYTAGGQ